MAVEESLDALHEFGTVREGDPTLGLLPGLSLIALGSCLDFECTGDDDEAREDHRDHRGQEILARRLDSELGEDEVEHHVIQIEHELFEFSQIIVIIFEVGIGKEEVDADSNEQPDERDREEK